MLSIHIHDAEDSDLETTDARTVRAVRDAYPVTPALVPAHDLASVLRSTPMALFAPVLESEEEATMVKVVLS